MRIGSRIVVAATLLIAVLSLALLQPVSGQPGQWRSINPVFPDLQDVWMVSANSGWAVGVSGMSIYWDGTQWKQVLTPFTGSAAVILNSVSCVSANRCLAAGTNAAGPPWAVLIQWDGTSWVDRSSLVPVTTTRLDAIYTRSDGLTFAVGSGNPNIIRIPDANLVPITVSPEAAVGGPDTLHSVFVLPPGTPGSIQGFAVGDNLGTRTTWRWDGAGWNNPHSPGGGVGTLLGVHMLDANTALAVGDGDMRTRWNGVSWTPEGGAVIAGANWRAVFMVSASDQWMVGTAVAFVSSIAHWTPSAWAAIAVPDVPTTVHINSVFMLPGGTDGWAVGNGGAIIRWNNTRWNSVANPTDLQLFGVWLASTADGWAVGKSGGIFRWNGQFWNLYQTLPSGADLFGVHGYTTNDVWAVGSDLDGAGLNPPAVVRWNGASWTAVSAGVPTDATLRTVFALSSSFAMSGGATAGGNPVIIKWDGTTWGAIPSSMPAPTTVNSIWMLGPTDGFAVGSAGHIERWNGAAWALETSPVPGTPLNHVQVIGSSCTAGSCNAWAVGNNGVIIHRDGTGWSPVPSGLGVGDHLRGIYMLSATEGWAVGIQDGSGVPFILFWDGLTWTRVFPIPSQLPAGHHLNAVWMVSSQDGWAVGGGSSVILRFSPGAVTTVSTAIVTATSTTTSTQSVTATSTVTTATVSTQVTSTETVTGTTTTYSSVTSTVTLTPQPAPIPGFPIESILAGLVAGAAGLFVFRRRRSTR